MHPSHNKVYLESLWTEIETLQWVLAQILSYYDNHEKCKENLFDSYQIFLDTKETVIKNSMARSYA